MPSDELFSLTFGEFPHPGDTIVDYLEHEGWSQRDLSRRTGITPKTISEICNGKASISPTTAIALEKVFRRPAQFWLALQSNFDESQTRKKQDAKNVEHKDWLKRFPMKEMKALKFSLPTEETDEDALLKFFGVTSPSSFDAVWNAYPVAYRQTTVFHTQKESVAAWVREVEIVASGIRLSEFDEEGLKSCLPKLRKLTRQRVDEIFDPLQDICASVGVAIVLVPSLPKSGISGCVRWMTEKRVIIGITLRYKTDDQLWFTIFHEIGHVLLHKHRQSFVVDNAAESLSDQIVDSEMAQVESEANAFARDTLIPPSKLEAFLKLGDLTSEAISRFATQIDIAPSIVVGRLQFDQLLSRYQGNTFKQKLGWTFPEE